MGLYELYFDRGADAVGYLDEQEYWRDWFAMLDIRIAVLLVYLMQRKEGLEGRSGQGPGLGAAADPGGLQLSPAIVRRLFVSAEEAVAGLDAVGIRWFKENSSHRDMGETRNQICMAQAHIIGRLAHTPHQGEHFLVRGLFRSFCLTEAEQFLLFLSLSVHCDTKYEALFGCLAGTEKSMPTLHLAFSLYELTDRLTAEEQARLLAQRGNLFDYLLATDSPPNGPPGSLKFMLSGRVYSHITAPNFLPRELDLIVKAYWDEALHPAYIRADQVEKVTRLVRSGLAKNASGPGGSAYVLHLYGENGNGKHFAVKHAACRNGCHVLFVDIARLVDGPVQEILPMVKALKRESILTHSLLCFDGGCRREEAEGENPQAPSPALDCLLKALSAKVPFFIWIAEEKADYLTKYPPHFLALESPMLTVGERMVLWERFCAGYTLAPDVDGGLFANQYILTAKGIQEVLARAKVLSQDGETLAQANKVPCQNDGEFGAPVIGREALREAVKQQSVNQLGQYAAKIRTAFTWADLVLDEEQKAQMKMICDQVTYRNVVGEEWGFHQKMPYGGGICALFYGSPGTGKTMAAQVIANELGMDLYRVDLSQMVSKYIGETEKNISALFRRAKNINALLFFDEADALFARRSEVKDAHDRHANSDTAHLLQELEDYSGITILATNYANNIDDAFKRRIRFMVNFVFPAGAARYRLWTTIVPAQMVYEETIDFEFFAERFELSGSNIREILLNAAYLAAAKHRGLANRDIVAAVKWNFAKYGKLLSAEDFGYLGEGMRG